MGTPALVSLPLHLDPLRVSDAVEMASVLGDPSLYTHIGGRPPTVAQLEERYSSQVSGSGRNDEIWHNWILRLQPHGCAVGFAQADVQERLVELAWVVGVPWQGQGYAARAARVLVAWAEQCAASSVIAHIHRKRRLNPTWT